VRHAFSLLSAPAPLACMECSHSPLCLHTHTHTQPPETHVHQQFVCIVISLTDLNLSNTHIPRTHVHQHVLIQDSVCLYFTDRSQPVNNSTTPRYRLWTNAAKVVPDQTEAGCVALCAAETKDVCLGVTFSHTKQNGNNSCYLIAPPLLHWDAEPGAPYPPEPMSPASCDTVVYVCVRCAERFFLYSIPITTSAAAAVYISIQSHSHHTTGTLQNREHHPIQYACVVLCVPLQTTHL